jgi:guanylate kinase
VSLTSLSLGIRPDGSMEWRLLYNDASYSEARWAVAKAMQIGVTVIFDGDLSGVMQVTQEDGVELPQWVADALRPR